MNVFKSRLVSMSDESVSISCPSSVEDELFELVEDKSKISITKRNDFY